MPNPRVVWVGRAAEAALCIPCPTCNAPIDGPCEEWRGVDRGNQTLTELPEPHRSRSQRARVLGFRDVEQAGGLFDAATQNDKEESNL